MTKLTISLSYDVRNRELAAPILGELRFERKNHYEKNSFYPVLIIPSEPPDYFLFIH